MENTDTKSMLESHSTQLDIAKVNLDNPEENMTVLRSCPSNKNPDYATELKNQLELAQQQVAVLDAKLDGEKRRVSEMQDNIQQYISDISNRDGWIKKLTSILQDVMDKSREGEVKLQTRISSLKEDLRIVEASSDEWRNRCESLEEQVKQSEGEMTEIRRLHDVQEIRWKSDTDLLKTKLNEKVGVLDTLKLNYDALEAEKVAANGKIQALEAEVESQKVMILDREEEKIEVIRQLCSTLVYYRNRYEELLQACKEMKLQFNVPS